MRVFILGTLIIFSHGFQGTLRRTPVFVRRASATQNVFESLQEEFSSFVKGVIPSGLSSPMRLDPRDELLASVAAAKLDGTEGNEEAVRAAFARVEKAFPAAPNLLDDPTAVNIIDGQWTLDYTVAAFGAAGSGGEDSSGGSERRGVGGAVNATGIVVDTTAAGTITTQTFDVEASRVANDITRIVSLPFVGKREARLQVSGPFTKSPISGRRADVRFDNLEIELVGVGKISIGWLFALVYTVRKEDGTQSWLETTHLSESLRLGRGNKGSIFVLTRKREKNK